MEGTQLGIVYSVG